MKLRFIVLANKFTSWIKDGSQWNRARWLIAVIGFAAIVWGFSVVVIKRIDITAPPIKTDYFIGDQFDTTGLEVTSLRYSLRATEISASDYTVSGFDSQTAGEKTITVSHRRKTANFTVTVNPIVLERITVMTPPDNTTYFVRANTLDLDGLEVTATYNNGSTAVITNYEVSGFDSQTAGEKTITISYGGKTAIFTVTVNPIMLERIAVMTLPDKTTYFVGDTTLDLHGLVVTASYNNGLTAVISNYEISGFDSQTEGEKAITISYNRRTAAFTVMVKEELVQMAWIPAGTFLMGSPSSEKGRWSSESPQHQVTLSGFYIGVYQITQEQYQAVMGTNPSSFSSNPAVGEVQARRPLENISWYDILVFANKLSIMEGLTPAYIIGGSATPDDWGPVPTSNNLTWNAVQIAAGSTGYRLPTEAQWEYACRAGTTTAFNNGTDDWENQAAIDALGWFGFNSGSMTREVGKKTANAWGLYDMHGNVLEWCWDRYGIYHNEAQTDPTGPSFGANRVIRGGVWFFSARVARSARRNSVNPSNRANNLGFRLVRPSVN